MHSYRCANAHMHVYLANPDARAVVIANGSHSSLSSHALVSVLNGSHLNGSIFRYQLDTHKLQRRRANNHDDRHAHESSACRGSCALAAAQCVYLEWCRIRIIPFTSRNSRNSDAQTQLARRELRRCPHSSAKAGRRDQRDAARWSRDPVCSQEVFGCKGRYLCVCALVHQWRDICIRQVAEVDVCGLLCV